MNESIFKLDQEATAAWMKMLKAEEEYYRTRAEYEVLKAKVENRLKEDQIKFNLKEC